MEPWKLGNILTITGDKHRTSTPTHTHTHKGRGVSNISVITNFVVLPVSFNIDPLRKTRRHRPQPSFQRREETAAASGAEVKINHMGRWQIPAGPELSQTLIGSCNSALIWLSRSMCCRRASCADSAEKFPEFLLFVSRQDVENTGRRCSAYPCPARHACMSAPV